MISNVASMAQTRQSHLPTKIVTYDDAKNTQLMTFSVFFSGRPVDRHGFAVRVEKGTRNTDLPSEKSRPK